MQVEKLSNDINIKEQLKKLGVDEGGINILASKATTHILYIHDLHVGAANILKQDALSIGADLAVPRGTVVAAKPRVDCILIANTKQLRTLAKKELAQPFALKELAKKLKEFIQIQKPESIDIMGIINANDDSFYARSRFKDRDAIQSIEQMIEKGATIIDIGAVSSRPNAPVVSVEEELARIEPLLALIKKEKLYEKVKFSCDSYEPQVLQNALESGFTIINDITGLQNDEVCRLCASYDAAAVIMHMQGNPQTMQKNPHYDNILSEVYDFFDERVQKAESFGIKDIILDVGIGFGKTLENNLVLLKNLEHFLTLQKPLLVGASRKSMINKISPSDVEQRLAGTLALHLEALKNGASILRVHDVFEHVQALKVFRALSL
ncbi:dihydropteroate synthase [Sulfurimonas autotrophica]|uniref:dihydropteroate synthase n=1 Tax=Sulfurimonas autotrophica (strain ATCC BAA-671 / DSM 16294 / JCM 11897 / OK10) TaxID=563040 RepID=E0UPT4_SULAO|nr:dihydropteroate synthase [Sulfurimonas autotrophica]ADN09743.1 dihydropteroate synthase [Sulfurimonas autotrophica DSM 16294]